MRAALFTGFLNPKGRILMDGIIVKPKLAGQSVYTEFDDGKDIEYWIDVEKNPDSEVLMK